MKAKYYSTSELAKKTGTSRQVISAILNDSWREKRISQATYERISEAMEEIGYVPDRTAISLRKEKRNTVGLLCHGPLYSHTLVALEKLNHYFLATGKPVEISVSPKGGLTEAIRTMMGDRVESIIILLSPILEDFGLLDFSDKALYKLLRAVPTFIYNFPFDVHDPCIEEDLLASGSHLVGFSRDQAYLPFLEYLKRENLTKILIDDKIFNLFKNGSQTQKICSSLDHVECYSNPQSGNHGENTFELGEALAEELLPQIKANAYDYLVTFSDGIAQGVAKKLFQHGTQSKQELKIIGFDKIDSLNYLKYPISTIEVPVNTMTSHLINLLEKIPAKNFSFRAKTKLHLH